MTKRKVEIRLNNPPDLGSQEDVATFSCEEHYEVCAFALNKWAKKQGKVIEKHIRKKETSKPWVVTYEQRLELAQKMQCLADIEISTSEHCPIYYDDLCELVTLKYLLFSILGIDHKKDEKGHRNTYNKLVLLKHDLYSEDDGADT